MAETFDVIVIGGGMAGASVSAELCRNARVLLLERESQPGYHATGRSAAAFIPSYGCHIPALRILTRASQSFFATPPNGFTEHALLKRRGLLTVMNASCDLRPEALAAEINPSIDEQVSVFTAEQIREKVPLAREEWTGGIYEKDVFDIDVDGLIQGYLRQCRTAPGFTLDSSEAVSIERSRNGWCVRTTDREYIAPLIVNAGGAWADNIAQLAGVTPLGLTPLRRTAALIQLPANVEIDSWPLIFAADGSFYLKPDAGLLLASPADEHPSPPCDAQPEELDVAFAAHYAEQMLDIKVERVSSSWAGLRTFAPDRTPVVGFDSLTPGFFWLAAQGGHGIQIAPALAQLAASLIVDNTIPENLEALGFKQDWVCPGRLGDAVQNDSAANADSPPQRTAAGL